MLGLSTPNIAMQKHFVTAKHFCALYCCGKMPSGCQGFLHPLTLCNNVGCLSGVSMPIICMEKHLVVARQFCTQSPYAKMLGNHKAFLCPISLCRNAQWPLDVFSKNIPKKKCLMTIRCFSCYLFPLKTSIGFSHQNEWHNVSPTKLING